MEADQAATRAGHQGCQAFHEVDQRHLEMGCAVAPGCLEFERHARGAVPARLVVGEGRARDVAARAAYWHHADGTWFRQPAFAVEDECTCGCGDAFNAGMAVALCRGMAPDAAVRFAQATAALNATGLGSQAGIVSFAHTLAFMQGTSTR